jgi:hypothetical protein
MVRHQSSLDPVLHPLDSPIRSELSLSTSTSKQLPLVSGVDGLLFLLVDVTVVHRMAILLSELSFTFNYYQQCCISAKVRSKKREFDSTYFGC